MLTIVIHIPDVENVGNYRRIRMGCIDIIQLVLLVVSVVTCLISFVTPNWTQDKKDDKIYHAGLWTQCSAKTCDWFLEEGFLLQKHLPGTLLLSVLRRNTSSKTIPPIFFQNA